MGLWNSIVDIFNPSVMSRIITGPFYRQAVLMMQHNKLLVSPGLDLAPAHVECARVIFLNTQDAVLEIELAASKCGCAVRPDSVVYYGTEGTPIID